MLQPFPVQNQPRPRPADLRQVTASTGKMKIVSENGSCPSTLTDQSHEPIRALAEVTGFVATRTFTPAATTRSCSRLHSAHTSRNQPRSTPLSARTTAPAISMVMAPGHGHAQCVAATYCSRPHDRHERRRLVGWQCQQTGPRRLAPAKQMLRRHVVSARNLRHHRARHAPDSATIARPARPPAASASHPNTDIDPTCGSESVIYGRPNMYDRSAKVGSHLAPQATRYKVGAEFRLLCTTESLGFSATPIGGSLLQRELWVLTQEPTLRCNRKAAFAAALSLSELQMAIRRLLSTRPALSADSP